MKIEATMQELSKKLEPKLCKDCRFFKVSLLDRFLHLTKFADCTHPTAIKNKDGSRYHLVDGSSPRLEHYSCAIQREFDCGTDAKHWEAKK